MSIATKRGDSGQTSLAGGVRVSKSDLRVETYGTVDELNTVLGFARSICKDARIKEWTEEIQRTLFRLGSNLATPPESKKQPPKIGSFRHMVLGGETNGTIAFRCGGRREAAYHCVWPT